MRRYMRKIVIALLSTAMLAVMMPAMAYAEGEDSMTRAEWISELVTTFDMTVEEDNMPDDYFADVTSEDS